MTRSTTECHALNHEDIHRAIVEYCGGEPAQANEWRVSIRPDNEKAGGFVASAEHTRYVES